MIMPRGHQLLLPANPVFMLASLGLALLVNMVQSMAWLGNAAWAPDWLALVLVFWCIHQPLKVGVSVAFCLGLLTDVHQTSLLGQHALTYTVQGYLATMIHRRILWFDLPSQALQVLPVFLAAQALELTVRITAGGLFPGWTMMIAPVLQAMLWPVITVLLLAPQRRAPDPDKHRPL
ncbi:MAG: rod shape-determining protein MreD [Betaproteobacteria bacterium]|nr:rod shape-determining protein MreD [Betaproteobacteria bacterium]